jgi:CubicO group peptidase (beta-lactamase class C family)
MTSLSLGYRAVSRGLASALLLGSAASAVPLGAQATSAQRAQVDAIFSRFTTAGSPGCVVGADQNGAALLRAAYGLADVERNVPMRTETLVEIGSVSKQFVAAALVLLEQDGKLDLDDPVSKYLPEFPDFRDLGGPVTIRQLLQHTSGVRDQIDLLTLIGRPYGSVAHTNAEVLELISRQRTLNFPVNTRYLYSNSGYTVSTLLVEKVSGKTLQAFTSERLFAPLGMPQAQWREDFRKIIPGRAFAYRFSSLGWQQDYPFSNLHGAGGLITTVDEMLRWTSALHGGRVGNGTTLTTMATPATLRDSSRTEYGLGLMVREWRGVREIAHSGSTAGYRAYLAHYPEAAVSIAMQCNAGNGDYVDLGRKFAAVFLADRLTPEVARPRVQPARRVNLALDGATSAALAGRWHDAETDATVLIEPWERGVLLRIPYSPVVSFAALSADSLQAEGERAMGLERDANGRVTALRYHNGRVLNIRFTKVTP